MACTNVGPRVHMDCIMRMACWARSRATRQSSWMHACSFISHMVNRRNGNALYTIHLIMNSEQIYTFFYLFTTSTFSMYIFLSFQYKVCNPKSHHAPWHPMCLGSFFMVQDNPTFTSFKIYILIFLFFRQRAFFHS